MKSRKEIKKAAKERLSGGIFGDKFLYMLLALFVASALMGIISSFIIGIVFTGIFSIGIARLTLDVVRKKDEKAQLEKVFSGFTDNKIGDNIILGLLIFLFEFLWSLLFIIPGIIKHYSYSMSYFIKIDNPEFESKQCIDESRKLMKGHKWQLFVFDLSFIGWYIVGALCLGVGTLWVNAYYKTALAEFYLAIKGEELQSQEEIKEIE